MEKKMFGMILALAVLSAAAAGCGKSDDSEKGLPDISQETEASEEIQPTEEEQSTDAEDAAEASADRPADFSPEEVYAPEEHEVTTVYEGCESFTRILDKEENKGKGYINVKIGDQDVLVVADQTYEYEPGQYAAIDAEIFYYKDDQPAYLDYVEAGGTAYPLEVIDDVLYVGGNHFMIKYTIKDDKLVVTEETYVTYDTDGNAMYYYRTEDTDFADHDQAESESAFQRMFGEMDEEKILYFDIIGGAAARLPRYEYPEDDACMKALSDYMTQDIASQYAPGGISIPELSVVDRDDSDPEDVKIWGYFCVYNYDLEGDVLKTASGGAHPGLFHIKDNKDGTAEVTAFDQTEDGAGYEPSAKKIFGDKYDALEKISSDDKKREETRKDTIKEYVERNDLYIKAYQDYGWDPVELD